MRVAINIPRPCSENWEAMQPDENGRHCGSCAKTVVDFTGWELKDIAVYLAKNTGKHVCGRFLNRQLNQPFDLKILVPKVITWHTKGWRKVAALIIVCFALASCNMNKTTDSNQDKEPVLQVIDDVSTSNYDSIQEEPAKQVARVMMPKRKANKSSKPSVAGVEPNESIIMGPPVLEVPHYNPPKDPVKYQPLIGPPEDTYPK